MKKSQHLKDDEYFLYFNITSLIASKIQSKVFFDRLLRDTDIDDLLKEGFDITHGAIFPFIESEEKFKFDRKDAYSTGSFDVKGSRAKQKLEGWYKQQFIEIKNIHEAGVQIFRVSRKMIGEIEELWYLISENKNKLKSSNLNMNSRDFTILEKFFSFGGFKEKVIRNIAEWKKIYPQSLETKSNLIDFCIEIRRLLKPNEGFDLLIMSVPTNRVIPQLEIVIRGLYSKILQWVIQENIDSISHFDADKFSEYIENEFRLSLSNGFVKSDAAIAQKETVELKFYLDEFLYTHKGKTDSNDSRNLIHSLYFDYVFGDFRKSLQRTDENLLISVINQHQEICRWLAEKEKVEIKQLFETIAKEILKNIATIGDKAFCDDFINHLPFNFMTVIQLDFKNIILKPLVLNETLVALFLGNCSTNIFKHGPEKDRLFNLVMTDFALPVMLDEKRRISHNIFINKLYSGLDHEIKTPLNRIKTFNESIRTALSHHQNYITSKSIKINDGQNPEELILSDFLEDRFIKIEKNVENIVTILKSLKLISSTHLSLSKHVDLNKILRQFVQLIEKESKAKGYILEYNFPNHPILIRTNQDLAGTIITRIFTIIYENALWSMEQPEALKSLDGGAELKVTLTDFQKFRSGICVEVRFSDTGIGIKEEFLKKIFEFGISERKDAAGVGMGLFYCSQYVEAHHGIIFAESEGIGKGATIVIQFPFYNENEGINDGIYFDSGG